MKGDAGIPRLRRSSVPSDDALDLVHSICIELIAVGKTRSWIPAPHLDLVTCLEPAPNRQ